MNAMCWDSEFKKVRWGGIILLVLFGFTYTVPHALWGVGRHLYKRIVGFIETLEIILILFLLFVYALICPDESAKLWGTGFDED